MKHMIIYVRTSTWYTEERSMTSYKRDYCIFLKKACKEACCAGSVSASARPQPSYWGDQEMETATSCTGCSQVASLINFVEAP